MSQYYDAFISYGRPDSKAFAIKLYQDLTQAGFKIWFDQNDIPLGVDFQNQIDDGIEKSRNFLFIIAPHSVNSSYCLKEIELALKYKKRIVPLLHVEEITKETWQGRNPGKTEADWEEARQKGCHSCYPNMHPEIGKINWVYFREKVDNYDESLAGLISIFNKHQNYVKQHAQILTKALDWERHQKQTRYLLMGKERQEAEKWLKIEFTKEQAPCFPNDLQCEYICESIKNANNLLTRVFLSYARENRETMEKIRKSLMRHQITVWTDRMDIKTGEEFKEAISRGIQGADNLVYLLSPEALQSEYCQQELALALSLNKRIISILIRPTELETIPRQLQELQFIDLTEVQSEEEYRSNLDKLIKELGENAVYYEGHKFLLVKALKWQAQNRNPSILLRGYNLEHYKSWLEVAGSKKLHPPIDLQKEFIAESAKQPPDLVLDVFISYSRADAYFARRLNDALQTQGKTTWFDQESIATGTDFAAEINRGIEDSDNFLFVISPESVNSPYCKEEVEYARSLNKRFVTVLHRQVNSQELHPELAKVQWLDFNRYGSDFLGNFSELVRMLDTDREYVREHTKKSQMALEWQREGKNPDMLLRGSECVRSDEWLKAAQRQNKQPAVTENIKKFIKESRKAQRRQKTLTTAASLGTIAFLLGLSIFAWGQKLEAERQSAIAFAGQLATDSLTVASGGLQQRGTLLAMESLKKLQELNQPSVAADTALRRGLALLPNFVSEMNHDETVLAVAFSPDGKYLATASFDNTARVWDAVTGSEIAKLSHDETVWTVAFSPDGKYLATASEDNTARVWDATAGSEVAKLSHDSEVSAVAFSPDSKYLATASEDNTARVWDAVTGSEVARLSHDERVLAVAFSPDGKYLATASFDKTARVWDAVTGSEIAKLSHDSEVSAVAFSPDSKYLATASFDKTARVWDAVTGSEVARLSHDETVWTVAFSPDSNLLATANNDNTARVWNATAGSETRPLSHDSEVNAVAFSPDGKYVATASNDNTARVWDATAGSEVAKLSHDSEVNAVAFSPDGKYVATASEDNTARVWNATAGSEVAKLSHDSEVNAVAFSPDGKYVATASYDNTARVWNATAGSEVARLSHDETVWTVAFSPDGKYVATASWDNTARVWDAVTGSEVARLSHDWYVWAVAFSPDSKYVATASWDNTARVWDAVTGSEVAELSHDRAVWAVAFSPDSKYLATASNDNTARVWDAVTGSEVAELSHDREVNAVAFSPDGKYLATASNDNTVRVWNAIADKEKEIARLSHDRAVSAVAFSPDGKYVATASKDKSARIHLLDSKDLRACDRLPRNLTANEWERYMSIDLEQYEKTCENLPAHPSVLAKGRELAKEGKVKEATAIFRRILKLEPAIDLNPDTEEIDRDPEAVARQLAEE